MLKVLSYEQRASLLKNYLKQSNLLSEKEISEVIEHFPFPYKENRENLNYLAVKLLRSVRKKLTEKHVEALSAGLKVSEEVIRELLEGEEIEVLFPVANENSSKLVKAMIIPLKTDIAFSTENLNTSSLEIIKNLAGKGFFLTFNYNFDFSTNSYMLSVYSGLRFGNKVTNIAFTGVLTPEGEIKEVDFLDKKISVCRENGKPLVFPHRCMRNIRNLEEFIENLTVPIAVLPGQDVGVFYRNFPFSEDYIRGVFHIDNKLFWNEKFENNRESFYSFSKWIEEVSLTLKTINESFIPFKVAFTGSVLCMSFFAGVKLSKARLPVELYKYENGSYRRIAFIKSDEFKEVRDKRFINVKRCGEEIKEVCITISRKDCSMENSLLIRVPSGNTLDSNVRDIATEIASELRWKNLDCPVLILEVSSCLAFATGYYLEDYVCLKLTHRKDSDYVIVHVLEKGEKKKPYLLNTFSINMLSGKSHIVEITEIEEEKALKILKDGFISYISHASTAQVLKELLNTEVEYRRQDLKLKSGDEVLVFQVLVRPKEGQVFNEEEMRKIIEEKEYAFYFVRIF